MATRERRSDLAVTRGRAMTTTVLQELRAGRRERNVAGALVAAALGCSPSQYSRLERGLTDGLTIEQATVALAAVGLDLSVRVYPGGPPIRDVAHNRLIERLRARCHRTIRLLTEVPLPERGDQRAWDVVLLGSTWRHALEVETRARDRQALDRRIALKDRDSGIDGVSLLLLDSRANREFVRLYGPLLQERFPVPAAAALEAIATGRDPGAGSVILL
jgi:transcriptional regulator with XRE-family HTH domain